MIPLPHPDLADISPYALAMFSAGRLPGARVAWLNTAYFNECGYNILDQVVLETIRLDLLEQFGVSSLIDPTDHRTDRVDLGADRYGGSDGTAHGGSGRCGTRGSLNAKGIGPTPLVSDGAAWGYSHGCLYLFDAIREVIAAEICRAELPNQSIPIVAIIDAGFSISEHETDEPQRCAIYVRPNFYRASHLERSVFFGTSGVEGSDQFVDAARTRDFNHYLHGHQHVSHTRFSVRSYCHALATQIAAVRAHRIWNGRPVTGNLTTKAQYFDYGAFRSLPNWKKADDGHGQVFGDDEVDIDRSIRSLSFFYNKYCGGTISMTDHSILFKKTTDLVGNLFEQTCIQACAGPSHFISSVKLTALADEFSSYFSLQQLSRYDTDNPTQNTKADDWIWDDLRRITLDDNAVIKSRLCSAIVDAAYSSANDSIPPKFRLIRACQWAMPRPDIYYSTAKANSQELVGNLRKSPDLDDVALNDYICRSISVSRRVWSNIPSDYIIIGYSNHIYFESLFVYSKQYGYDILYCANINIRGVPVHSHWIDHDTIANCSIFSPNITGIVILSKYVLLAFVDDDIFPADERPFNLFSIAAVATAEFAGTAPWTR